MESLEQIVLTEDEKYNMVRFDYRLVRLLEDGNLQVAKKMVSKGSLPESEKFHGVPGVLQWDWVDWPCPELRKEEEWMARHLGGRTEKMSEGDPYEHLEGIEKLEMVLDDMQSKIGVLGRQVENANNALMTIAVGKKPTGELLSRQELREIADGILRSNSLLAGEV